MKSILSRITAITAIVSFALSAAASAQGYGLSGMVTDAETGAGIESAFVRIMELNSGVSTADTGAFTLVGVPAGTYTVKATAVGYAPSTTSVTVPSQVRLEIELSVTPIVVDEVISTARGRHTRLTDTPGSVAVVDETALHETNAATIAEALSRKPGISVSADMPWGARAVIRGMTRDQVVMLVDGARVVTATAVPAQFGLIAQGDIERLEVLKGPISVLYGSGSTGGVVNVITRKGRFSPETKLDLSLHTSYESAASGLSLYERATVSSPRLYLGVSQANRKYGDYSVADQERIPNSQFQDRQTQINVGLKLSGRHTLEVRYQNFSVIDVGIPGGAAFSPKARVNYPTTSRQLVDAAWTWRPGLRWIDESRVNVYYQPVERNVKVVPNVPSVLKNHPTDASKQIRMTLTGIYPNGYHYVSGARWQNTLVFGGHTVVAGIEGWRKKMVTDRTKYFLQEILDSSSGNVLAGPNDVVVEETPVPDSIQRPVGAFAEDSFKLGDRTRIALGGRIDHIHTENEKSYLTDQPPSDKLIWDSFSDDDVSWSLVAGAVYGLTKNVDLNLTAARSFRSPTIEERYLYAELGGVLTTGDPEIDSEKGTFIEGGVTAQLGSARLTGAVFLNNITDMVVKMPGGDLKGTPVDYQYTNAGEARLRGFEAGADWALHGNLLLTADVSFIRGTDEKYDTDLPSIPPMKGHLGLRWNVTRDIWISPLLTLVDRQDKVADGERETPGYGVLDIAAGKSVLKTGSITHDIVVGVKNAGDRLYRDHLTVSRGYELYGMGRSFYVSWRMNGK